jgi:selenocysteine-specific elongation factor
MRVIGTAGHVDHGKSTLVAALSGIDPDRLKEEKARGMTIDLGFAWIDLPMPDGSLESVGIVDVPGHIDFIKNMLAGVGGIDAVVLVIAADEGVMPQTREHLAILDLLAVPAGVVALTKSDLIDDPDWLELVELEISELLEVTRLADAPIVPVSAVSGAGLDDLRRVLAGALGKLPPRRNRARPRLPIDRVFTLSGFGAVVTGTLVDGAIALGDAVEVLPAGLPGRVRGLQTHKRQVGSGQPGSRLAINLSGVEVSQLHRGDVVTKPGTLQPTVLVDVHFRMLADAIAPLRHNQAVDFFSGAAEIPARARVLGAETVEAGQEGWLQLRLERPTVVASGDRYILRLPSPSVTLGGGEVLSPHPRHRWRRFDPATMARLRMLAKGAPDEIMLQLLLRQPFITAKQARGQSELDTSVADDTLAELVRSGAVISLDAGADPLLAAVDTWERLLHNLSSLLGDYHRQSPLRRGMARGEVRSRLQALMSAIPLTLKLFNVVIERAQGAGVVRADDSAVWLESFSVALTPAQQAAVDRTLAAFAAAPFSPPNAPDTLALLDQRGDLFEMLIEQGRLVRLGGDVLLRGEDLALMIAGVQEHLRIHGSITLADARDLFQTSRKYVQALLEEMDNRRITRREGDVRVLR